MDLTQSFNEDITRVVAAWPGVSAGVGTRGEWGFKVGGREIGHLHGDHVAHFGFPKDVGKELRAQGRITDRPVFPGNVGMGQRRMDDASDAADVIALLRLNYERAVGRGDASRGLAAPAPTAGS